MTDPETILTVTTTVASPDQARALARHLLDSGLAACVQVDAAITSFYRWAGRSCEDPEVRLVIKTLPECEAALQALFAAHHPYDVPQFVATPARASAGYAKWVRECVRTPGG